MTPENFCYWLQGFFEIQNPSQISESQIQEIKNHLALVFNKVTPMQTDGGTYNPKQIITSPSSPSTINPEFFIPQTYCDCKANNIYGDKINFPIASC
jgi:hypothetical protein